MARTTFEVTITMKLTVKAKDESKAENLVMDLFERHLGDMLDCPAVVETSTSYTMSPTNPKAREVKEENCPKCGKQVTRDSAFTDEGTGAESGRTFYYCSEHCRETH